MPPSTSTSVLQECDKLYEPTYKRILILKRSSSRTGMKDVRPGYLLNENLVVAYLISSLKNNKSHFSKQKFLQEETHERSKLNSCHPPLNESYQTNFKSVL